MPRMLTVPLTALLTELIVIFWASLAGPGVSFARRVANGIVSVPESSAMSGRMSLLATGGSLTGVTVTSTSTSSESSPLALTLNLNESTPLKLSDGV